ncbi:MAG: hypothetical protein IPJ40_05880 [Saprospirales bacterium]|nr:hypothetical protein [Saprospirales bacterium]
MLEKNRDILAKLLRQLPAYSPPDRVWEVVGQSLANKPKNGLDRLPSYQPPEAVWDRIESVLAEKNAPKAPLRRFLPWAATIAATLAGVIWYFQPVPTPGNMAAKVSITYSRETVDPVLLQRDWEQDEDAFELINRFCANSPFTCTNPDMKSMQAELDELTEAKVALEEALGTYGTDADLIGQLTEIERQRTALLKQMLDYFI